MFAYLDPATGSMIAGGVAAGLAGVGVAAKSALGKFRRKGRADDAASKDDTPESAEPATARAGD